MDGRRLGFLWDPQRDLVDAHWAQKGSTEVSKLDNSTISPEERLEEVKNPSNMKSSLKQGPASADGFGEVLRTIRRDLLRIERYWYHVAKQPGGEYEWQDRVLPQNIDEMEQLRDRLTAWLEIARDRSIEGELDRVNPIFDTLTDGINSSDTEELQDRYEALVRLLRDEELRELFDWISENPDIKIKKDRKCGNISAKQAASSTLKRQLGLIEHMPGWEGKPIYRLSSRGERVRETLAEVTPENEELVLTWGMRRYTDVE